MGGLPLRTPTHRRHGGPLPRRLPNATHARPPPDHSFQPKGMPPRVLRGIRPDFSGLSPCGGWVAYVLLTRAPVAGTAARKQRPAAPRLACVKPVASGHPEPGSNSPLFILFLFSFFCPCTLRFEGKRGSLRHVPQNGMDAGDSSDRNIRKKQKLTSSLALTHSAGSYPSPLVPPDSPGCAHRSGKTSHAQSSLYYFVCCIISIFYRLSNTTRGQSRKTLQRYTKHKHYARLYSDN